MGSLFQALPSTSSVRPAQLPLNMPAIGWSVVYKVFLQLRNELTIFLTLSFWLNSEQDRSADDKPKDLESEESTRATRKAPAVDEDKANGDAQQDSHQSQADASNDKPTPKLESSETKAPPEPPKVAFDPTRINVSHHFCSFCHILRIN